MRYSGHNAPCRVIFALILSIGMLSASIATAQDDGGDKQQKTEIGEEGFAKPSDAQLQMNKKAVNAVVAKNYQKAINLFQGSLELGKLNITYLNLGRAHQKAGNCREAYDAFKKAIAKDTPKLKKPTPERVKERAKRYMEELKRTCPGQLVIECSPEDMEIFIDNEGPKKCREKPYSVPPGKVVVKGEAYKQDVTTTVDIKAIEQKKIKLTIPEPDEDKQKEGPKVKKERVYVRGPGVRKQPPKKPKDKVTEGIWIGLGTAVIGGAVYADNYPAYANNGEFDIQDTFGTAGYVTGGIILLYGLTNIGQ